MFHSRMAFTEINPKKGQLLRLKRYYTFNNGVLGSKHRLLPLEKNDVVMFLGFKSGDWSMTSGPKGSMRHVRRNYTMKVLHGETIWYTGIIVVEDCYNEFHMTFTLIENADKK